ncbi:hypothetical protein DsansV1_C49g0243841 [Dioscorea sansibarensis]
MIETAHLFLENKCCYLTISSADGRLICIEGFPSVLPTASWEQQHRLDTARLAMKKPEKRLKIE